MTDYAPPEAAHFFAEVVHRHQAEAELQRRRLKDAPIGQLKRILQDPLEPFAARAEAMARRRVLCSQRCGSGRRNPCRAGHPSVRPCLAGSRSSLMATRPLPDPSPSDSGIIIGNDDPSRATAAGGPVPSGSDSGITVAPGGWNLEFRREVAAKILDTLTQAYVTRREFVLEEARRRGVSVEELLAAYLTRSIMDKVDREYI
jgi:hypothetical protein